MNPTSLFLHFLSTNNWSLTAFLCLLHPFYCIWNKFLLPRWWINFTARHWLISFRISGKQFIGRKCNINLRFIRILKYNVSSLIVKFGICPFFKPSVCNAISFYETSWNSCTSSGMVLSNLAFFSPAVSFITDQFPRPFYFGTPPNCLFTCISYFALSSCLICLFQMFFPNAVLSSTFQITSWCPSLFFQKTLSYSV